MQAGAGIEQPLAVGPAELHELLLQGPDDVELRWTDLGQPLQSLALVTQRATRIEAPSALEVVAGTEVPAGTPGAKWLVPGVGGDEGRGLERRAGVEPLGEGPRIDAAVGVLVRSGHNRPFRLTHIMPSSMVATPSPTVSSSKPRPPDANHPIPA